MRTKLNTKLIKIQEELLKMDKKSTLDQIMINILETIMKLERQEFLKDIKTNKWNWYYNRFLKLLSGKISLNIPRDRNGIFRPLILEIMKHNEAQYMELVKKLYFKWLTHGDINWIMKNIYWTSIWSGSITNLTNELMYEFERWKKRKLKDEYAVLMIDSIYCKVRRWFEYQTEWFTIVLGMKYNGTREILGIYWTPQESINIWKEILKDIKNRWVKKPLLLIADWINKFEDVVGEIYPKALFQKCIVHKMRNVLNKVRASDKEEIGKDLKKVFNMYLEKDNKENAIQRLELFINKRQKKYKFIKNMFSETLKEYYFTYLSFPFLLRNMIYTTNWLERFNKGVKKKIKIRNWLPNESAVIKLIFATVLEFQEWPYNHVIGSVIRIQNKLYEKLEILYW